MNAKQKKHELGSELIDAIEGLMRAVEGVGGALDYGTFRGDRAGIRFKDTPEWVKFYVAWSRIEKSVRGTVQPAAPAAKPEGE